MDTPKTTSSTLFESFAYSLGGALTLYGAVHYGIPFLQAEQGVRPLVGWWLSSGVIFLILAAAAVISVRLRTPARSWKEIFSGLNLQALRAQDVFWSVGGLLLVLLLTGALVTIAERLFGVKLLSQDSYSSFLRMEKLTPEEHWLFLAWLPYFFFNIVGEEALWRGYLLPRQAGVLGRYAWILNGFLWAVFHVGIGWRLAIVLLPTELILPYVVQKRRNTWVGVVIHGLYNGSGFVIVALGVLSP